MSEVGNANTLAAKYFLNLVMQHSATDHNHITVLVSSAKIKSRDLESSPNEWSDDNEDSPSPLGVRSVDVSRSLPIIHNFAAFHLERIVTSNDLEKFMEFLGGGTELDEGVKMGRVGKF
jgi:hypothetical protein